MDNALGVGASRIDQRAPFIGRYLIRKLDKIGCPSPGEIDRERDGCCIIILYDSLNIFKVIGQRFLAEHRSRLHRQRPFELICVMLGR